MAIQAPEIVELEVAKRKWDRMFADAVARSIAKAITEPVTNSWDSYKRQLLLPRSSGLVQAILDLNDGDKIDHSKLIARRSSTKSVSIRVLVATSKTPELEKRECRIIDQASGMSYDEVKSKLREYGEDKSGQSEGEPVRGMFGQGLSDVLFGHDNGFLLTFHDDQVTEARATHVNSVKPAFNFKPLKPNPSLREKWGIIQNGTVVRFRVGERCPIPADELLYKRMCNFYTLRLINADPRCNVSLECYRSGGKIFSKPLMYEFWPGRVIAKNSTTVKYDKYDPITIDWIAIRADEKLKQSDADDDREGGFLVVDECDTVYDLTLFDFENQPGLDRLYGIVRITGLRELIKDRINNHGEALIRESRDGFDTKTDFVKKCLWPKMKSELEPLIRSEKKASSIDGEELSEDMRKRVHKAFSSLNALYRWDWSRE